MSEGNGVVNLGFVRADSALRERCGRSEVILGQGKTALEAAVTLEAFGRSVERIHDIGVADAILRLAQKRLVRKG